MEMIDIPKGIEKRGSNFISKENIFFNKKFTILFSRFKSFLRKSKLINLSIILTNEIIGNNKKLKYELYFTLNPVDVNILFN